MSSLSMSLAAVVVAIGRQPEAFNIACRNRSPRGCMPHRWLSPADPSLHSGFISARASPLELQLRASPSLTWPCETHGRRGWRSMPLVLQALIADSRPPLASPPRTVGAPLPWHHMHPMRPRLHSRNLSPKAQSRHKCHAQGEWR